MQNVMQEKKMRNIHNNRSASEFFFRFARFEYALKAAGYHPGNGVASPDWTKFAKELDGIFENPENEEFREAIDYYLNHPPKKQLIENSRLVWREVEPHTNSKADLVLQYVRRVRNNLFHGGKFKGNYFEDPERSEDLIQKGLIILNQCLESNQDVYEAFEG